MKRGNFPDLLLFRWLKMNSMMDPKILLGAAKKSGLFFLEIAKSRKFKIGAVAVVSALILAGGSGFFLAWWQIYTPLNGDESQYRDFTVEKGQGVNEIARKLQEEKIIKSSFWFEVNIWRKKQGLRLQAGKYSLSASLNIDEIGQVITGGKIIPDEITITLPEGFTLRQMRQRLFESGITESMYLGEEQIGRYQLQYKFLADIPAENDLEGFLFPDTYRLKPEIELGEISKRFLENFDKKLTPVLREEISRQGKTLYQILTMASIIQKEALNETEMATISGIFWNRIEAKMKLQSDATVNYATGKNIRQVTYSDLEDPSPYNTYKYEGLPPGPICNPGIAAIKAAIYPASTNYYYFFHPLGSSAVYSRTGAEHEANRAKYLK